MRRLVAAGLSIVVLSGCADAFRGHQDVVARAGGSELTVEQIATMLGPAKQVPLRREIFERVAGLWVDYQLLAQILAGGDSLLDSATVERANWPVLAQLLASRLHDTLIVSRAQPTDAQVDSAFGGTDHRYLYHILFSTRQDTTDARKAARRRLAEQYLARLRAGGNFQALARQVSEDPGSREFGGLLGLVGRGVTVRAFEEAAFALEPGQLSGVVETPFGFHILWRPRLGEVRDSFALDLEQVLIGQLDSIYLDSLTHRTGIRVRGSAPAIVRRAAEDPQRAKRRSRVLATYTSGRLRESDFAQWLQAFPPQTRSQVLQAPDSTLMEFVKSITRNHMLLTSAREMGIRLRGEDWDSLRAAYRRDLQTLREAVGLLGDSVAADSAGSATDLAAAYARQVDAYFTAITNSPSSRRFVEVPPFLADVLRERGEWDVYPAGIERAIERARVLRGPEEERSPLPGGGTGTPMSPAPQLQPAPGGPPVGGRGQN